MRFLVDTQLPRALASRLRESGHEAGHVLELAMGQSPDNDLWRYAAARQETIVSKDEDFADWVRALEARNVPAGFHSRDIGRAGPAVSNIVSLLMLICFSPTK
jgi:hypothetical protein